MPGDLYVYCILSRAGPKEKKYIFTPALDTHMVGRISASGSITK